MCSSSAPCTQETSTSNDDVYDVIIVGGGHAGIEAALAAARHGSRTLLLSLSLDRLGWQPCNPAVGGAGKSQLVHEVDALGGVMGQLADMSYVQKRVLNASKGPAVWSLRAQTDKKEYASVARRAVENQPGLSMREAHVDDVVLDETGTKVVGVKTRWGVRFMAKTVVLTAGTFLNGTVWIGRRSVESGRAGEESGGGGITARLEDMGIRMGRLKTGTPARVDARSVDLKSLELQEGDAKIRWFSWNPSVRVEREQMPCYLTHTSVATKELVLANLHETPTYGGWVDAKGPRYCPSIEDKMVRFTERDTHQIFLEPEGRSTNEMYVQGLSTGLPEELQLRLLRTIPGLEKVEMLRPAYAVDYDYIPAAGQVAPTLETRRIANLFISGQLLGTTGYEEAAAQGLLAGVNASRRAQGMDTLVLPREGSYMGTLIDDLVTKEELREPYRMMTSRSEWRLLLRSDNAARRMTPLGRELGLVGDAQWALFCEMEQQARDERARLASTRVDASGPLARACAAASGQGLGAGVGGGGGGGSNNGGGGAKVSLESLLRRPKVHSALLEEYGCGASSEVSFDVRENVEIDIKYEGFIQRQEKQLSRVRSKLQRRMPLEMDYASIATLSKEAREKLEELRPETLGQAARIAGVSPADINSLMIRLETREREKAAASAKSAASAASASSTSRV